MQQPLANHFAEYTHSLRFEDLPQPTVHEVKRRLIDSIATSAGAMDAEAYAIAKKCAARVQGNPGAAMIGGGSSSVEWATFVNGLLIRYLDFNDTYLSLEPAHPSDNLAAVLAVGDMVGATGKEMITASVIAYEIQCRLCDASSLRKNGFDHVTYGAISSCAAACRLLNLDPVRTTHAIGIAGVCNTALRQTRSGELSMWKGCAFANAARNGVFAALLAAEGMTGPTPIFEGELGFMKLLTGDFAVAPLGGGDQPFMINETYIKFWPAEYHSQSAIDAALQLKPLVGDVSKIKSLDIHTFNAAVDIIGKDPEKWRPKTRETADHSLPYCTAVALLDGDVTMASFDDDKLADATVLDLVAKIKLHRDAEIDKRYPAGIPNRLTVTMEDGKQHVKEVEQKYRATVEPRYGKEAAAAILKACWELDAIRDARELVKRFALPD